MKNSLFCFKIAASPLPTTTLEKNQEVKNGYAIYRLAYLSVGLWCRSSGLRENIVPESEINLVAESLYRVDIRYRAWKCEERAAVGKRKRT